MPKVIATSQILDAALDVMLEHGYTGATTRQIAEAAGINEVTLFRRFGSKKRLIAAAVEQEALNFAAAGIDYTGDLEADLTRIVRFYRDLVQKRGRMIVVLISELPRQPELMEVFETPLSIIEQVTALIARYQREGELAEEPPFQTLAALVGPLMIMGIVGTIQPALAGKAPEPAEQTRRFLRGRAMK